MRAVIHTRYGTPDVLELADVAKPVPADDEVLVKVHATTVNRTDCGFRAGKPYVVRAFSGLRRPKQPILGTELAGEVEAVGSAVTDFSAGDQVFGVHADRFGAHAEYVCVKQDAPLALKPAGMSYAEAAAVCDGVILALTCLRRGGVHKGRRILIYGASGSIGTAAVQLARYFEAHVTAVCTTKNVELVRSLGADVVVDYTREDYTTNGEAYDVLFDAVGKSDFEVQRIPRTRRAVHHHRPRGITRHKKGRTTFLSLEPAPLTLLQQWAGQFHTYWGTGEGTFENYDCYLTDTTTNARGSGRRTGS